MENWRKWSHNNYQILLLNNSCGHKTEINVFLGPVVQSVVSLTSSLRAILLTILADSIYNFLKFFAEKMWVAFALQKLLTFFQQKISEYLRISLDVNFNESLTNDVVSFEQLGPDFFMNRYLFLHEQIFVGTHKKHLYDLLLMSTHHISFHGEIKTNVYQGPVVQSIVSLTSSLRIISLTILGDSIHNILIFFAEKMWVLLHKLLAFFQQKISAYLRITPCKF